MSRSGWCCQRYTVPAHAVGHVSEDGDLCPLCRREAASSVDRGGAALAKRALSLTQPWAWVILHAGKRIENRVWDTRFRGVFYLHAAKRMTRAQYTSAVEFCRKVDPGIVVPPPKSLPRGGIVGRACLVDVLPPCVSVEQLAEGSPTCPHPWHMEGQFGFVLDDVQIEPFLPCAGALGFWRVNLQGIPMKVRQLPLFT